MDQACSADRVLSTESPDFLPRTDGELGTFTGHVTIDGVTTRYDDAPLDAFITDDKFVEWVCRAATGD